MFVLKHREIFIAKYPTIHPSLYKPLSLAGPQGAWAFFSWYHARSRSNSRLFDSPLQGLTDGDGQGLSSLSNLGGNSQSPVYLMCLFLNIDFNFGGKYRNDNSKEKVSFCYSRWMPMIVKCKPSRPSVHAITRCKAHLLPALSPLNNTCHSLYSCFWKR